MKARLICLVRRHQWHNGWDEDPASDGVDLQALWFYEARRRDGGPSLDGPRRLCGHMKGQPLISAGRAYEGLVATVTLQGNVHGGGEGATYLPRAPASCSPWKR
jgi:hypothetical protein